MLLGRFDVLRAHSLETCFKQETLKEAVAEQAAEHQHDTRGLKKGEANIAASSFRRRKHGPGNGGCDKKKGPTRPP